MTDTTNPDRPGQPISVPWVAGWLTALAFIALCVAVWNLISPISSVDTIAWLIAWPTAIQPSWAGVIISGLVFGVLVSVDRAVQPKTRADGSWHCSECPENSELNPSLGAGQDHVLATRHTIKPGQRPAVTP